VFPGSSARGLFQLLQKNYHYNPNGVKSFGNPVEEAQGGIRSMRRRFKNPSAVRQFWQKHKWW
jgi:SLT domain-containing protein